MLILLLVNHMT